MKSIALYGAVVCASFIAFSFVVKTPSGEVAKAKTTIQANIDARKAALDEI